jgi:hypothetical protein
MPYSSLPRGLEKIVQAKNIPLNQYLLLGALRETDTYRKRLVKKTPLYPLVPWRN